MEVTRQRRWVRRGLESQNFVLIPSDSPPPLLLDLCFGLRHLECITLIKTSLFTLKKIGLAGQVYLVDKE